MRGARPNVAVLISGRGSNLGALIAAAADPAYPARIALVVSNVAEVAGLTRAESAGIPSIVIPHRRYGPDRAAHDAAVDRAIRDAGCEFVCLAGYMRLLTAGFVAAWQDRLVNIHPSLLPAFRGLDTHARALAAGVRVHGCTVHLVRPDMDDGPILGQAVVPVRPDDDVATLSARVLEAEHRLYPTCVAALVGGRVVVAGMRATIRGVEWPSTGLQSPL